jgi:hypothetical protein
MKSDGKTEWEKHQEMRLQRDMPNVKWVARVVNQEQYDKMGFALITEFTSENTELDGIAHKIKLDLITNLLHGFESPILIEIKKVN